MVIKMMFFFALCALLFLSGCASSTQYGKVLALVNEDPVTEEDLKYSLNIAHRRDKLSNAGSINLSDYLQKLIDDKLIVQEAYRMGLDETPAIKKAIKDYILRESVVRLFNEEIASKVSITEKDILDRYKKDYERLTLSIIELNSEEAAQEVTEKIKAEADFKRLAMEYATNPYIKESGEINILRGSLIPQIEEAVSKMSPGVVSDVIKVGEKYLIFKLIDRQEAPDEEFPKVKSGIEKALRKAKEKEISDEYLKQLRAKIPIKIHNEILSTLKLEKNQDELENLSKDTTPLVEIYDSVLTVGDFVKMYMEQKSSHYNMQNLTEKSLDDIEKTKEKIINIWIDFRIVDYEALSRHYEKNPDLNEMIKSYTSQLLKDAFIKEVIIPRIKVTDDLLKEYYLKNQKNYLKPIKVKIQSIVVKTEQEAQDILNSIEGGADFAWLAKRKSINSERKENEEIKWQMLSDLHPDVRDVVIKLKPGEITSILKIDSYYGIIKLIDRTKEEPEDFNNVKSAVFQSYFEEQLKKIYESFAAELRKEAKIEVFEDVLKEFEEKFQM